MKLKKSSIVLWMIAIIVLAILLFYNPFKSKNSDTGQYDSFAQCLTDVGVKMYGTEWCPHCQNQKKLFGKSFKFINYIDCDKNKQTCLIEGIQGYPTWKLNGQGYTGEQSFESLAKISGCKLI